MPYRIETLYEVLENSFNVYGAKTIVSDIARKFYSALGLEFHVHDGYSLSDYLKQAKKELRKASETRQDEQGKPNNEGS